MEKTTTEKRKFKVDDNVIYHLIESQGGSLKTALRELVQNSYDAKATKCEIVINEEAFSVSDNGNGFQSKKEIEDYFETFGTPHTEDVSEKFGRFRMGRSQIMAFGKTIWYTNTFVMEVCMKTYGLNYHYKEELNKFPGCKIEGVWYEKLSNTSDDKRINNLHFNSINNIIDTLVFHLKYIQNMDIFINGHKINIDYKTVKWTKVTNDYYFLEKGSEGVNIYNLGIFVSNSSRGSYDQSPRVPWGLTGDIITRKHLELNLSRDKVKGSCKILKNIYVDLNEFSYKSIEKKEDLDEYERKEILINYLSDNLPFITFFKSKILYNVITKKYISFSQLCKQNKKFSVIYTDDYSKNKIDKVYQQFRTTIICDSFLDYEMDNIIKWVDLNDLLYKMHSEISELVEKKVIKYDSFSSLEYLNQDFDELIEKLDFNDRILNEENLTKKTKIILSSLRSAIARSKPLIGRGRFDFSNYYTKIHLGESKTAKAWTDGSEYIIFDKTFVERNINIGLIGCSNIMSVWIHELCHQNGQNEHDFQFYEKFHKLVVTGINTHFGQLLNQIYFDKLRENNYKVPKGIMKYLPKAGKYYSTYKQYIYYKTKDLKYTIQIEDKTFYLDENEVVHISPRLKINIEKNYSELYGGDRTEGKFIFPDIWYSSEFKSAFERYRVENNKKYHVRYFKNNVYNESLDLKEMVELSRNDLFDYMGNDHLKTDEKGEFDIEYINTIIKKIS